MTFTTFTNGTIICLTCGAQIGNTVADRVEHLTTPSRARAAQHSKDTKNTTTKTGHAS